MSRITLTVFCLLLLTVAAPSDESITTGGFPDSWQGVWKGTCHAYLSKERTNDFAMELRIAPLKGGDRWTWTIVYGEGEKQQKRDYELAPMDREKGLYRVDEKNSILIDAYFRGDGLFCQYSVEDTLITLSYTLQGESIRFELLSSGLNDPTRSGGEEGIPAVLTYPVTAVQRAALVRQ